MVTTAVFAVFVGLITLIDHKMARFLHFSVIRRQQKEKRERCNNVERRSEEETSMKTLISLTSVLPISQINT